MSPHSLEAECAVLGAIMAGSHRGSEAIEAAAELLTPLDFFRVAHRDVFAAMLRLRRANKPTDLVTVIEALRMAQDATEANPAYVASLVDGMPSGANVASYAATVREYAVRRELIQVATDITAGAKDLSEPVSEALDSAQQGVYGLAMHRAAGGFVSMSDVMTRDVMPLVEVLTSQQSEVSGVPTGLHDLDAYTRGLQPSDLILLAARPSMGKTALAMCAAVHAATEAGRHVGVFSLEMSRRDLGLRAVIAEAGIDGTRVRSGRMSEVDWSRLAHATGVIAESTLHIDDASTLTVHDIRARARRLKAQVGLDLIVVDYLQLVTPSGKRESRNLDMGEISAGLKAIAKDLQVPVMALSQLSRACESRQNKRPQLSDLRDSGALEQDADVVVFIYRDEVYDEHSADAGIAELSIAKHRNGATGTVRVGFQKQSTRFVNLERHSAQRAS